ncbi:MAG: hypothetical protein QM541_12640 [Flavobacterium sp.]|nr:hypothetical protein [Flavobacterium sp.]
MKENILPVARNISDNYPGVFLVEDAASFNAHTKTKHTEWKDI